VKVTNFKTECRKAVDIINEVKDYFENCLEGKKVNVVDVNIVYNLIKANEIEKKISKAIK